MEPLIPITGFAKTYDELCNKVAESGEYYNVLDESPFTTYHKLDGVEIGDTLKTTDIIGWFPNKAEMESNVRPAEGEVYITGIAAPYQRWKYEYVDYVLTCIEDGEEELKIVKKYKNKTMLTRGGAVPEEGVYYAVGKEAPYAVYGVVSSWEPVGTFISWVARDIVQLKQKPIKSNPGEIAYIKGLYYLYDGSSWTQIDVPEPIENVGKHTYQVKNGDRYRLREGQYPGTLEYYQPRS